MDAQCRVCLSTTAVEYIDLAANLTEEKTYLECFNTCTQLNIQLDDELPSILCYRCSEKLAEAYDFIQQACKADEELHKNKFTTIVDSEMIEEVGDIELIVIESIQKEVIEAKPALEVSKFENDESFNEVENTSILCVHCSKMFNCTNSLLIHDQIMHSTMAVHYSVCPFCQRPLPSLNLNELITHLEFAHPIEYENLHLEQTYENLEILEDALETIHSDEMEEIVTQKDLDDAAAFEQCKLCNRMLLRRNLEKHFEMHAKRERKFLCSFCPRHFKNYKTFQRHENTHTDEFTDVVHTCVDCLREFNTGSLLEQHRRNTHKERDHICTICGNGFKLKNQLRNHMNLHLAKTIECPHCDKKYARQFDLNVHLRSHTNDKPFACHLCEKRFPIKVRLTYHLQKHYGIKHACKECGAEFNSKQKLKAHSFKHTGMPYRCELCDDHGFPNRDVFKRHLIRVHQASISEEELIDMFKRNTGKMTRICQVDAVDQL